MNKKLLISFGLVALLSNVAMAHSTIYVDEIGRLHFLGKDPGSAAARATQLENFNNPMQKDLTDVQYKNIDADVREVRGSVNTYEKTLDEKKLNAKQELNKSRSSYEYTKGAMDASNPYTYGETNISNKKETNNKTTKETKKKKWFSKD